MIKKIDNPTKKIIPKHTLEPCFNPQHNPPNMQVFSPGVYEHTCPGCGKKTVFTVPCIYF